MDSTNLRNFEISKFYDFVRTHVSELQELVEGAILCYVFVVFFLCHSNIVVMEGHFKKGPVIFLLIQNFRNKFSTTSIYTIFFMKDLVTHSPGSSNNDCDLC